MITHYGPKTPDGINSRAAVSIGNSSVLPLGISATFTGLWEDVSGYNSVVISVIADAVGTLKVEFSSNAINADVSHSTFIEANQSEEHRYLVTHKYFRVVVENGLVAQTFMRLQSLKGTTGIMNSTLNSITRPDDDAITTKAITQESITAEGKFADRFYLHKFGRNPDIDSAGVPADIWDGQGIYTGFPSDLETLDVFSSSGNDSAAGTGMRTLRIFGLDTNYDLQEEDIVLNGVTSVTTVNTYRRVYRVIGLTAGTSGSNEGVVTVRHTTTIVNIFTTILIGMGQSAISNMTIPVGFTGYLQNYKISLFDTSDNNGFTTLWYRELNACVRQLFPSSFSRTADSVIHIEGGLVIPQQTDIIFRVNDVINNNADISVSYDLLLVKN